MCCEVIYHHKDSFNVIELADNILEVCIIILICNSQWTISTKHVRKSKSRAILIFFIMIVILPCTIQIVMIIILFINRLVELNKFQSRYFHNENDFPFSGTVIYIKLCRGHPFSTPLQCSEHFPPPGVQQPINNTQQGVGHVPGGFPLQQPGIPP